MDTDDEQLYSSEFENEPPKKSSKKKNISSNTAGVSYLPTKSPIQSKGAATNPTKRFWSSNQSNSAQDNFLMPKNQSQPGSGVVYEEQQIPPSSLLKDTGHDASITKTFSSTLSNTEASENLGENPLELLLLSLEVRLEPHPEFESYIQELALILKNITVQSGNPEQPIPRLIELAKMTVISQKKASETDFSLVIPPTMEQVKQEMRNNNSFDSFKNNKVTSEEE
ncbi:hypothetical protein PPACK8108_LOCUS13302 [Phakopsora pachyrhizi]|uniref:Uncharacterized protein n=1 Tax=Phakopsora pachyrhizi TaxID=170000 RepID=A0AAV0B4N4_PHAPC|nr:hypothetical protein PPACK8108_LOCUS13302 [Phakopsora pachyrhizi]